MNVKLVSTSTGATLPPTTAIVFGDEGGIFFNPNIIEADGEDVIFERGEHHKGELLGKAVTPATLTVDEAIRLASAYIGYEVYVNNKLFTRDRRGNFCTSFVKQRGHRTWLLPVTYEDAKGIIEKTKRIVYYTYNRGAKVVAA